MEVFVKKDLEDWMESEAAKGRRSGTYANRRPTKLSANIPSPLKTN
jgi:hypothetical protein